MATARVSTSLRIDVEVWQKLQSILEGMGEGSLSDIVNAILCADFDIKSIPARPPRCFICKRPNSLFERINKKFYVPTGIYDGICSHCIKTALDAYVSSFCVGCDKSKKEIVENDGKFIEFNSTFGLCLECLHTCNTLL